jgi:hypothetical protein
MEISIVRPNNAVRNCERCGGDLGEEEEGEEAVVDLKRNKKKRRENVIWDGVIVRRGGEMGVEMVGERLEVFERDMRTIGG